MEIDNNQAARCPVFSDRISKNRAWLIRALTTAGSNGFDTKNTGSGLSPVNSRSGNAVMKITGTVSVLKISFTASRPELPSAR